MQATMREMRSRMADTKGLVMPLVIFALVVMSTVAIVALVTGGNEQLSARATRESSEILYAAEAGLQEMWATWPDSAVAEMNPGEDLDLGWKTLDSGASYRAVIQRVDDGGGQAMYALNVDARGAGARGALRSVSLFFTGQLGSSGNTAFEQSALVSNGQLHFGDDDRCTNGQGSCDTVPGAYGLRWNDTPWTIGQDVAPPDWAAAECDPPTAEKPAIVVNDDDLVDFHAENDGFHWEINGDPASESVGWIEEDGTLDANSIFDFGGLTTRDDLIAMANHTLDPWDGDGSYGARITRPTLNGNGTCNTDDPYNWGSPDPSHPCYNYFPIIYIPDGAEIRPPRNPAEGNSRNWWECPDYYGQAILVATGPLKMGGSCSTPDGSSTTNYTFNGIVIVDGCLELQYTTTFSGTAIINDDMSGSSFADCDVSGNFESNGAIANANGIYQFSSCAVRRVLDANDLGIELAFQRLPTRAFVEPMR